MTVIYRCNDGREFHTEAEAREHENSFWCTDKAGDTVVFKCDGHGLIVKINNDSKPVRIMNESAYALRDWITTQLYNGCSMVRVKQ